MNPTIRSRYGRRFDGSHEDNSRPSFGRPSSEVGHLELTRRWTRADLNPELKAAPLDNRRLLGRLST